MGTCHTLAFKFFPLQNDCHIQNPALYRRDVVRLCQVFVDLWKVARVQDVEISIEEMCICPVSDGLCDALNDSLTAVVLGVLRQRVIVYQSSVNVEFVINDRRLVSKTSAEVLNWIKRLLLCICLDDHEQHHQDA